MNNVNPAQNINMNALLAPQAMPAQPPLLQAVQDLARNIRECAGNNPPWILSPDVQGFIIEGAPLTAFEAINSLRGIFGGNNAQGFEAYPANLANCAAPVRAVAKEVVAYALSKDIGNKGAYQAAFHLLENDADTLTVQTSDNAIVVNKALAAVLMNQ